jgi:hypothetical protein
MRIAFFVLVLAASSAAAPDEPALFPIPGPPRLVGYIDATGKVVVPPRFESTAQSEFSEGLAAAGEPGGRQGYIDHTGRFVIPPTFPDASAFSEGLAFVHALTPQGVVDGTAYIDRTGRRVIHFPYRSGEPDIRYGGRFSEGMAAVARTRDYKDTDGVFKQEKKWGYVDKTGTVVIPTQFDAAGEFSEGLANVQFGDIGRDKKVECGYVDHTGKVVFRGPYGGCGPFKGGLAAVMQWVTTDPAGQPEERYGYVDKTGKVVVPLKYGVAKPFSDGLACVREGETAGFIDKTGAYVLKAIYRACDSFSEGLAPVVVKDKWGFIDKTGKLVVPARFDWAQCFKNGLAQVAEGRTLAYVDKTGKTVWSGPVPE